jgi:hypothetical protein
LMIPIPLASLTPGIRLLQLAAAARIAAAPGLPAADSARLLRAMRSAQTGFEAYRRARLPVAPSHGDACDVRIGRYCYWRGDEGEEHEPPEPDAIVRRRNELIVRLDSAERAVPGDGWIAGQLVHYLVDAGHTDDALHAAQICRAGTSWCAALAGYAAHQGGRYEVSDSMFHIALAAMEPAERCRWLDIAELLDDELATRFERMPCDARERFVPRLLRISAPLYSVAMTDLLTEHLARLTRARIAEHAASVDNEPWADDERELVLRYGWSKWYTRTEPDFGSMREPAISGHDPGMAYDFLATLHGFEQIGHLGDDDWRLDDPHAATGYAPDYARSIHALPSQIASFRRGDSTLVVAAWDARSDTTMLGRKLEAALALSDGDSLRGVARSAGVHAVGRISAIAKLDSGIASLELLDSADHHAARRRIGFTTRAAGSTPLSGLLLYAPGGESAFDLDAVRDSVLAGDVVARDRKLGVYWEAYELPPGNDPVTFTLTIEQTDLGFVQRAAERMHLADPTRELRVQWSETPRRQANGIAGRGISVDFSQLRPGRYRLQLTVAPAGQPPTSTSRELTIR